MGFAAASAAATAAGAGAGATNVQFRRADAYRLPFADGAFDVTHCHQIPCHMDAPADALREMLRVTRPGGLVAARGADRAAG